MQNKNKTNSDVFIGRIAGVYGIKGWVKVISYTRPKENITRYATWFLDQGHGQIETTVEACKAYGKSVIAKFKNVDDRDEAMKFHESKIYIRRHQLPELAEDEYYWHDLMGMTVIDQNQNTLGEVIDILETGANDVFVVSGDKRRLIPWVNDVYIKEISIQLKQIHIHWQDEDD